MIGVYFDPIIPPPFSVGVIRLYLLNEGRKISTEIKKDFERSTKTWSAKPRFEKEVGFTAHQLTINVFTTDENYERVSEGTIGKPRVARKKKALTIIPYKSKTVPGQLDARPGGEQPGPIIFRRYALEAGKIEKRKFDDLINEEWDPKMADRLQEAMDAAAVKTGFAF